MHKKENRKSQELSQLSKMAEKPSNASVHLNSFGAKFQTIFVVGFLFSFFFFLFLNKLSIGKNFILESERLSVIQRRS